MRRLALMTVMMVSLTAHAWDCANFKMPSPENLRKKLTDKQFKITQEKDTERPFDNPYWDQHGDGIFVDVVSGEPLFSSKDKYDSHTGWPSFTKPISPSSVVETKDGDGQRMEVLSHCANSHLGHVFDDGPAPTHQRYCMNSGAMRFIPKDKLASEGYPEYIKLFYPAAVRKHP